MDDILKAGPAGNKTTRQRFYASLFIIGLGFLLFRTLRMVFIEEALITLASWAVVLLFVEMFMDLSCVIYSVRWFIYEKSKYARLALRWAAAAIIIHGLRVLVFVIGRTGPWHNFDVRPEARASYSFDWFWVYFAAILATLGIIGVVVVWAILRKRNSPRRP